MDYFKIKKRILLVLSFVVVLSVSCQRKIAPKMRQAEKIYFLSNRDAPKREFDIFSMNPDGSGQKNLTMQIAGVRSYSKPCISHDGTTLLFVTLLDLKKSIQAMTEGDSMSVSLTELEVLPSTLRFSPDDQTILFTDKVDGSYQIFTMHRDGSNRRNLSSNRFDETNPSFSPDGKMVCYETKRGRNTSIAIMQADGSHQRVLTSTDTDDFSPSFSPDGKHILFTSDRNGTYDIFLLKISNKETTPLYTEQTNDFDPVFMPDGEQIMFGTNFRGKTFRDVLLLNLKTKKRVWITKTENRLNHNPVVTPDGKFVIFESSDFVNSEIIRVDVNTLIQNNLSNHQKLDILPSL